jgi:hypothetical protein
MGENDAGSEARKIGPRSDYFCEPPPWYRLVQKNGFTAIMVAFALICCGVSRIELRNAQVCGLPGTF